MNTKTIKAIRLLLKQRNNRLPVLDHFLIDREFITATDLSISVKFRHRLPVDPEIESILVPADYFIKRIETIKAPYLIKGNDSLKVSFIQGENESKVSGMVPAEFPKLPGYDASEFFTISQHEINIMNEATSFISDDFLRPVMCKICLDVDYIAASDAHKLYYRKINQISDKQVLFEKPVIKLMMLSGGQNFKIYPLGKNVYAESPDMMIWWRRDETEKYPAWRKVVPGFMPQEKPEPGKESEQAKPLSKVIIPVKETINVVDGIIHYANSSTGLVKIHILRDRMTLYCNDLDEGVSASESINIFNPEKKQVEFGVKGRFLLQVLKSLQKDGFDQVSMEWNTPDKAFVFQSQILLMPMMINE